MGINAAYYELVLPYLAPHMVSMPRQVLGLASLALGLLGVLFASVALVAHDETIDQWWQAGGPVVLLGVALGVTAYALTAVYGRALAIAVAPTLGRDASR